MSFDHVPPPSLCLSLFLFLSFNVLPECLQAALACLCDSSSNGKCLAVLGNCCSSSPVVVEPLPDLRLCAARSNRQGGQATESPAPRRVPVSHDLAGRSGAYKCRFQSPLLCRSHLRTRAVYFMFQYLGYSHADDPISNECPIASLLAVAFPAAPLLSVVLPSLWQYDLSARLAPQTATRTYWWRGVMS